MIRKYLNNSEISREIIETSQSTALGGILLILFTVIVLVLANSPWKESYHHLWEIPIGIEYGQFFFEMHLLHWINDGLMAIFFYMVGLEIKREIKAGALSSGKKATFPALGALGGILLPALIFTAIYS